MGLEVPGAPMWSPDGRHILYVSIRGTYMGVYRKASDGTGGDELLFRYTEGAGIQLTDISPDGKFLTFSSGGVVLVVALTGTDVLARKAIEFSREEFDVAIGHSRPTADSSLSLPLTSRRNDGIRLGASSRLRRPGTTARQLRQSRLVSHSLCR